MIENEHLKMSYIKFITNLLAKLDILSLESSIGQCFKMEWKFLLLLKGIYVMHIPLGREYKYW